MSTPKPLPENLQLLAAAVLQFDGAEFELIDDGTSLLGKVTVNGRVFYPSAVKVPTHPLNSANAAFLVNDKAFTYTLLDRAGVARTEGRHFYARAHPERYGMPGIPEAHAYAAVLGYPVFMKPNQGAFGYLADVCFNEAEITKQAEAIAVGDHVFHMQRAYVMPEFRVFCIDGEVIFGYERTRPIVVGDGDLSVRDLIKQVNSRAEYDIQMITNNNLLAFSLAAKGYTVDTVLPEGEELSISAAANIARGGEVTNLITSDFPPALVELSATVHREFNIRLCGIDFFASSFTADDVTVIEVNQNPSLKGISTVDYDFAISVWHQILKKFAG